MAGFIDYVVEYFKGPQGDPGPEGPQGEPGAQGPAGESSSVNWDSVKVFENSGTTPITSAAIKTLNYAAPTNSKIIAGSFSFYDPTNPTSTSQFDIKIYESSVALDGSNYAVRFSAVGPLPVSGYNILGFTQRIITVPLSEES